MTWIFSKAMVEACESLPSSPEQAEESSEESCSDGEPYAQLNVKPTQHKFWRNDKMMDHSTLSRFGLTLRLLTDDHGEDVLMSFLEAFPVRTSHQQGEGLASREKSQDYGSPCETLLAIYDHGLSTWRIQASLFPEDSALFSETWPQWGTMRGGVAYQPQCSVPSMYDRGYGFLPTPTAHNAKEGAYPAEYTRRTPTLATHAGGKINPEWTEWLMGWPLGWTDLKPLATDRFQQWQQQHSIS